MDLETKKEILRMLAMLLMQISEQHLQTKFSKGDVFNVGTGTNVSINELASLIGGKKIYNKAVDEPFANLASIEKINKILGWKPRTSLSSWLKDWSNY